MKMIEMNWDWMIHKIFTVLLIISTIAFLTSVLGFIWTNNDRIWCKVFLSSLVIGIPSMIGYMDYK